MTSFSPVTRFVGLLVLPPALATLVAHGVWSLGGGEARCAAELDLSTPGFICVGGLDLLLSAALFTGFHVLVGMPLAWWAARRRLAIGPILRRLAVTLLLLGAPLVWMRVGHATLGRVVWETYGELGFPLLLALAASTVLARYLAVPGDPAHAPAAPAA